MHHYASPGVAGAKVAPPRCAVLVSIRIILVAVLTVGSPASVNAQWSMFSHHDQLRAKVIVDVGTLSRQTHTTPSTYDYDPLLRSRRWKPGETMDWLEFRGQQTVCMDAAYFTGSSSQAVILLTDADERLYVATFESAIGSIRVELRLVTLIRCPSRF